jgi:hypothetical protein
VHVGFGQQRVDDISSVRADRATLNDILWKIEFDFSLFQVAFFYLKKCAEGAF